MQKLRAATTLRCRWSAVFHVSEDRVLTERKMRPNLMRDARGDLDLDQRPGGSVFQRSYNGACLECVVAAPGRYDPCSPPRKRLLDRERRMQSSDDQCPVSLDDAASCESLPQLLIRLSMGRGEHETGGVFVETVDETRFWRWSYGRESRVDPDQSIGEAAAASAAMRVEAGRFRQDPEVVPAPQDPRLASRAPRIGYRGGFPASGHVYFVADGQSRRGHRDRSIQSDSSSSNQ